MYSIHIQQVQMDVFNILIYRANVEIDIENILLGKKVRELHATGVSTYIPTCHYMYQLNYIPEIHDITMYSLISYDKVSIIKMERMFLITDDYLETAMSKLKENIICRFNEILREIFSSTPYIYPTIHIVHC